MCAAGLWNASVSAEQVDEEHVCWLQRGRAGVLAREGNNRAMGRTDEEGCPRAQVWWGAWSWRRKTPAFFFLRVKKGTRKGGRKWRESLVFLFPMKCETRPPCEESGLGKVEKSQQMSDWEGWQTREEWMPRAGLQASSPCAMPPIFPFPHLRGTSDQSSSWIFQSCVLSSDCGKCVTHWVTSTTCYHFLSFHFPKQVGTGKPWGGWGHAADMWTYPVLSWRKMKGILTSESGDFISMPLNEYVYAIKYF